MLFEIGIEIENTLQINIQVIALSQEQRVCHFQHLPRNCHFQSPRIDDQVSSNNSNNLASLTTAVDIIDHL